MASDTFPILRRDSTPAHVFQEAVWSRVFNHRRDPNRVPRAVVKPTTVEHIRKAVLIANEENCRVSIRSGGHSWAIWSVRHDAVLLDLENFNFLEYNAADLTVSCSPSTTGKQLSGFLATKGRSFPVGHMSDIGLGGFLLGRIWVEFNGKSATYNEIGWATDSKIQNIGQACELIVSFDMVAADGSELHCSNTENEELFWLVHGGGPGFPGIITKFTLQTRPFKELFMTMVAWPIMEASQALPWALEACKHGDPDTECIVVGMNPPHSPVSAVGFVAFSFKKSREEAQKLVDARFANYPKGAVVENICNPSSIPQASAFLDSTTPEGSRICADTAWLSDDSNVAEIFMQALSALPSKNSSIIYMYRPRTDVEKTAFLVTSHHFFSLYATWQDEVDDEKCIDWVRKTYKATESFEVASAISDADFQVRTYKFWSSDNAQKVMSLRKKWDSNGRFCGYLDAGDKAGAEGLKTRA